MVVRKVVIHEHTGEEVDIVALDAVGQRNGVAIRNGILATEPSLDIPFTQLGMVVEVGGSHLFFIYEVIGTVPGILPHAAHLVFKAHVVVGCYVAVLHPGFQLIILTEWVSVIHFGHADIDDGRHIAARQQRLVFHVARGQEERIVVVGFVVIRKAGDVYIGNQFT